MKAHCFGSSSGGNCFLFEMEGADPFFLECGIEWRKVLLNGMEQGLDVYNASSCLITHSHGDHCKAWKEASSQGISLFSSKETLEALGAEGTALEINKPNRIAEGLYALPFPVRHDAVGSVGYYIKTKTESIAFVNDNKGIIADVSNFKPDYLFVECNYYDKQAKRILDDLKRYMAKGEMGGEYRKAHQAAQLLERNMKYHSSLLDTADTIARFDLSKCKAIFLMHLSGRYANEFEMKGLIKSRFRIDTYVCGAGGGIK